MEMQVYKKTFLLLIIILSIFILGLIDLRTGFELNFFVFYFIPLCLAALFFGIELGIAFSIICALVWFFADKLSGHIYSSNIFIVWNTLIRLSSFVLISWLVNKINMLYQSEKRKTADLQKAVSEIKILESFLSICCVCKKIRDKEGGWQHIESYISSHSATLFSHGYCPECAMKAMTEAGLIK
ncbi:MAG: hypothetical protein KKE17_08280 [Proteobacteria bacterium]|nr:hypothetical protein [Pseudomonadota bacterium]MBU1709984.1 hypothetical protein [Pseudomonadota bacterium]